VVRRGSPLTR